MKIKDYVQAAVELVKSGQEVEKVLDSVKKYLTKRGEMKQYRSFLKGFAATLEKQHQKTLPRVTLAKQSDYTKYEKYILNDIRGLGHGSDEIVTQVSPYIIGGYTVSCGGKRVDCTYRAKLLSMYRKIVG